LRGVIYPAGQNIDYGLSIEVPKPVERRIMQSNEINELAAALSKAQGEFTAIPKSETNPFFKSKYAGLPDVVNVAAPILAQNGLAISQFIMADELGMEVLRTYLLHSSGQFIWHDMKLHLGKLDSQGQGSAVTYARRYSYMSVLGLVADEDDDGNKASQGEREGYDYSRPANSGEPAYVRGGGNEEFDVILEAAELEPGNTFLASLSQQLANKGTLSPAQIGSGVKAAMKVITG
jgi:hypothetical protein